MDIKRFTILFVGGIHGVGKSVFSTKVSEALSIPCLSASKLITAQRNAPAAIDKRVSSVEDNQDALVKAIESSPIQTRQFLLDGHFCVFDTSDSIQRVPLQTFETLAPVGVILLFDEVESIQNRLEKRERRKFSVELLESLQQAELEHADKVCRVLQIPLCSVAATEHERALQFALRCFAKIK